MAPARTERVRSGGELVDLPAGRQARISKNPFYLFYVYAISSLSANYIYVGLTSNIENRLKRHNKGWEKTTKPYSPFKLILKEQVEDRKKAREREKYWKSGIGKEKLRKIQDKL